MLIIIDLKNYIAQQGGNLTRHDLVRTCAIISRILTDNYCYPSVTRPYYPSEFVFPDRVELQMLTHSLCNSIPLIQKNYHPPEPICVDLGVRYECAHLYIPTRQYPNPYPNSNTTMVYTRTV